jgi:hypothetical protein
VIGQDEVEVGETGMSACSPYPSEFARAHEDVGDITEGGTVIGDHGEEEGGLEVWEEFVSPDVVTSPPLPTSFHAMGCEVENTELGACTG